MLLLLKRASAKGLSLKTLSLKGWRLGEEQLMEILRLKVCSSLETLNLSHMELPPQAIVTLCPLLPHLRSLHLCWNPLCLNSHSIKALSHLPHLRELDIAHVGLTTELTKLLLPLLSPFLETLILEGNYDCLQEYPLLPFLFTHCPHLKKLNLNSCHLTTEIANNLLSLLPVMLETLFLDLNPLFLDLRSCPLTHSSRLKELSLSNTKSILSSEGKERLQTFFPKLTRLDLSWNEIPE